MKENVGKYKSGRAKVCNEHFNQQWEAWVQPLIAAIEKQHGAPVPALIRRRNLAQSQAADATARMKAEQDLIRALEKAENLSVALRIQGNRQSFARYNRDRFV